MFQLLGTSIVQEKSGKASKILCRGESKVGIKEAVIRPTNCSGAIIRPTNPRRVTRRARPKSDHLSVYIRPASQSIRRASEDIFLLTQVDCSCHVLYFLPFARRVNAFARRTGTFWTHFLCFRHIVR